MSAELACSSEYARQNEPSLESFRLGVEFFNVQPDVVSIEVEIANTTDQVSPSTPAVLKAAPFGAFLPWETVAVLSVPRLAPSKVQFLRTRAHAIKPAPLGSPDRVPPRKLLTAFGLAGDSPRKRSLPSKENAVQQPQVGTLPPDLMAMLLQETPHWIGNINVLVRAADVERHVAKELRVYPGRLNLAWFFVGHGGHESYCFRLEGLGKEWQADLFDMTARGSLVLTRNETGAIRQGQWIQAIGTRVMLLALRPPANCCAGAVEVHVDQRSTGRTAAVEFSLDPRAAGRGCYVV